MGFQDMEACVKVVHGRRHPHHLATSNQFAALAGASTAAGAPQNAGPSGSSLPPDLNDAEDEDEDAIMVTNTKKPGRSGPGKRKVQKKRGGPKGRGRGR